MDGCVRVLALAIAVTLGLPGSGALAQSLGATGTVHTPPRVVPPSVGPTVTSPSLSPSLTPSLPPSLSPSIPPSVSPSLPAPTAPTAVTAPRAVRFSCEVAPNDQSCREPGAPDGGGDDAECRCGRDPCYDDYDAAGGYTTRTCEKLQ
jgi:hypothetical protein